MTIKDQLRALKPKGGRVTIQHKYPHRVQRTYQAELLKLLARLEQDINQMVKPAIAEEIRTDSLSDIMRSIADLVNRTLSGDAIARRIAAAVANSNEQQISKAVAKAIGVNVLIPGSGLSDKMEAWVIENTSLITSMQRDYVQRVQNVVAGGFRRGQSYRDMAKDIQAATGISKSRATLIARDQIGSLNAAVTQQRDEELGIDSYVWRAAMDRRTRGKSNPGGLYPKSRYDHYARDGKTFKYNDPPPDGNPGEPIQCRCFAEAVIEF